MSVVAGQIAVTPGSGKILDCAEVTVGAATVEREIVCMASPSTAANYAEVTANGDQQMDLMHVGGVAVAATAKGTQATNAVGVQELKDAGRTLISFVFDNIAGITTEALGTMTINKGGTTTTGTTYTVSTGKTLRIVSFALTVINPSTTAAASRARIRSGASVTATSSIVAALAAGAPAAVAFAGGMADMAYPDGIEIAAGQQVGISHIESSTIASGVNVCVVGFEY